jgi:hypothetical protein
MSGFFPALLWAALRIATPSGEGDLDGLVLATRLQIRAGPSEKLPVIGQLKRGGRVAIERCIPHCRAPKGWALIAPRGAVRLSFLKQIPRRAHRSGPNTSEAAKRSLLRGIQDPPEATAFLVEAARVHDEGIPEASAPILRRYDHLPAYGRRAEDVVVMGGSLVRSSLRLACSRLRPTRIPADAKWVHVDLRKQTLMAYEGDRPVYATLVSTGAAAKPTPRGLFRSWLKIRETSMKGGDPPYYVESVPDALFFAADIALHGATWHDLA